MEGFEDVPRADSASDLRLGFRWARLQGLHSRARSLYGEYAKMNATPSIYTADWGILYSNIRR